MPLMIPDLQFRSTSTMRDSYAELVTSEDRHPADTASSPVATSVMSSHNTSGTSSVADVVQRGTAASSTDRAFDTCKAPSPTRTDGKDGSG